MSSRKRSACSDAGTPARWWRPEDGKAVCFLCPRLCRIGEGQAGFCFIRVNRGGELRSLGYGRPAALQVTWSSSESKDQPTP